MLEKPIAVVVMGVTGSGKTTVGVQLAARIGCQFYDGDDYHPAANVEKMRQGIPLTDEDRAPWLDRLNELLTENLAAGKSSVLACSALRQTYRARLVTSEAGADRNVRFVYLRISPAAATERLLARPGHFMPPTLVGSQFEALEEPEDAIRIDATEPVDVIVQNILAAL